MSADISVCKNCKRMFQNVFGQDFCPSCAKLMDEEFERVREYVRDNPGHTAQQVAETCGVSLKMINKWVRDERLEFSSAEGSGLNCEKCRKPIATGRFCDNCKAELRSEFRSAMPHEYKVSKVEKKDEGSTKMRFLNR